jgi:uncharacterized protein
VVTEWLYRTPGRREAKLFDRQLDKIEVGSSFKEGRGIQQRTRSNALFLSVVAQFNGTIARQILEWFADLEIRLGVNDLVDRMETLVFLENDDLRNEIIQFVKQLDLGIQDIRLEQRPITTHSWPRISSLPSDTTSVLPSGALEALSQFVQSMQGFEAPEAYTVHRIFDGEGHQVELRAFDLDQHESEGTKKLFGLAGSVVPALKFGSVLVVDEIDARLHPLITCAIIALFNNPETNPHNAQLILTTHDTNLLSNSIFRRDQVWFVEKDRFGASHLYSLVEFKVRNDASFEKDYIHGRYGAIPFIGNLGSVLEQYNGE